MKRLFILAKAIFAQVVSKIFAMIVSLLIPSASYLLKRHFYLAAATIFSFIVIILYFTLSRKITNHDGFIFMNGTLITIHLLTLVHGWLLSKRKTTNAVKTEIGTFTVLIFLCAGIGLGHTFKSKLMGFELYHIPSRSMEPTLNIGDIVLVDTWPNKLEVKAGTVVVFKKHTKGLVLIKRMTDTRFRSDSSKEFFVQGDNRSLSLDSRQFGWVPTANIIGIAKAKLFSVKPKNYDFNEYPSKL